MNLGGDTTALKRQLLQQSRKSYRLDAPVFLASAVEIKPIPEAAIGMSRPMTS
jgi:hypothetical protein